MPSIEHETPVEVIRSDPAIVPALMREALGIELPPFVSAEEASADFTQLVPTQFRADLVIYLRGETRDGAPVMGVVIEVQRKPDPQKEFSWPLYVAALHARIERPTCLLVLALDEATAEWAAKPITSLQPGSPFLPLVIGPAQIPRVDAHRAMDEPFLAVLSALAHGNDAGGVELVRAAFDGLRELPSKRGRVFVDLILASLDADVRRAVESDMDYENYKYKSDYFRKDIDKAREDGVGEGLERGLTALRRTACRVAGLRIGELDVQVVARIESCDDIERLEKLILELSTAGDPVAVEKLLHDF